MESSRLIEQLTQFGQKIPQKAVATLLTILLVIYSAYLVAVTGWKFVDEPASVGTISTQPNTGNQQASSQSRIDVNPLRALNLFGKEAVKKAPPKPEPKPVVTSVAPKTKLNLTLTGIVADNSSKVSDTSVAIIESRNGQETYGIGQKISGTNAKVSQILLDRVILTVGLGHETLMLDGIEYSTTIPGSAQDLNDNIDVDAVEDPREQALPPRPVAKKPSQPTQTAPVRTRPVKKLDHRDNVELSESLRDTREQLFSDPSKIMDVIRISPERDSESGEIVGYRLMPGKDPALFKEAGLKVNDLAVDINGYDLTNQAQAFSLMSELRELTEATITVMRDGSPVQVILAL
jgi:general secretion pathway protein C